MFNLKNTSDLTKHFLLNLNVGYDVPVSNESSISRVYDKIHALTACRVTLEEDWDEGETIILKEST